MEPKVPGTENEWYFNRAKFDAETFWYRANGNVEILRDVDFKAEKYPDQNILIYGNKDNNAAWKKLLNHQPIQIQNNSLAFGKKELNGDQWGTYFIVPRKDSETASIGVIYCNRRKGNES